MRQEDRVESKWSWSGRQLAGALGGPGPRHELVEARGRPEIDQPGENVSQIHLRVDAAELAGLDQRGDAGPVLRALIMPGKECILSVENNLAVILPMSGRTSPSTIAGIPCVGEARAAFRSSGAPQASLCMSS